ncbi:hypothetical protein HA402_000887 [Bradysia odoriphaga]|nr:hypothetical protein HA402_000887 [Bradysia odoriphaga]
MKFSSIIGADSDCFSEILLNAIQSIKIVDPKGNPAYPIKTVNVLKAYGKSASESLSIQGLYNFTKAKEEIDELDKTGVQVLLSDLEKLEGIRSCELDITKERIDKIMATGVSVILSSGGIDDLCLKYFADAGAMAVIGIKKADLKRIAKATGAAYLTSLTNVNGEESFEAAMVGEAAEAVQERICDDELISIKGPKARTFASIILGGPNDCYFDEMDHDALCVVKRVLEGKKFVVGGGCVEAALSIYLENFTISLVSIEKPAIAEFDKSLLVIPRTLAVNAAKDATDLVAKLRAFHNSSQTKLEHTNLKWCGLDLIEGIVKDNRKAGVLEPAMSKIKSLKFATQAATTILRIRNK